MQALGPVLPLTRLRDIDLVAAMVSLPLRGVKTGEAKAIKAKSGPMMVATTTSGWSEPAAREATTTLSAQIPTAQ